MDVVTANTTVEGFSRLVDIDEIDVTGTQLVVLAFFDEMLACIHHKHAVTSPARVVS